MSGQTITSDFINSQAIRQPYSLRDLFAAAALTGLLAGQYRDTCKHNLSEVPEEALKIADAMLAAREGTK